MDRFDTKKIILYLSGILIFVILIMIVLSIDDEQVKKEPPTQSNVTTTLESTEPLKTSENNEIELETNSEKIEPSESIESTKRKGWESNGTGYLKLSEAYRKAFLKAANTNDMTEIEFMLVKNSDIYKKQVTQIEKLSEQKIKLSFKSSKLINFSDDNNKIILNVSEEIGIKKDKEESFTYSEYKFEYTFLRKNQGLLISNISGDI